MEGRRMEEYRVPCQDISRIAGRQVRVEVPGSKSITNRALLFAALSQGDTLLRGVLFSDDSRHLLACLKDLGFEVRENEAGHSVLIRGMGGRIPKRRTTVNVGSAGTAARFLAALLGISEGEYVIEASEQMKARPMQPLIDTLRGLGAGITCLETEGHLPFKIIGAGLLGTGEGASGQPGDPASGACGGFPEREISGQPGNSAGACGGFRETEISELPEDFAESACDGFAEREISGQPGDQAGGACGGFREMEIDIGDSSQFLSALMIAFGIYQPGARIRVKGRHGMSYIRMSARMMQSFGVTPVISEDERAYEIPAGGRYHLERSGGEAVGTAIKSCEREPAVYDIEPDASAAGYFLAAAALLGISVTVKGLCLDSLQGDVELIRILGRMGADFEERAEGLCVTGPSGGKLRGGDFDMSSCSDQAITIAAIAPYAQEAVTIRGIGHIRLQESNRIDAILTELRRCGIRCCGLAGDTEIAAEAGTGLADGIRIYPGIVHPAEIETYDDHRMAMGFALTGLRSEGIVIKNPMCCRKTFENYFETLESMLSALS